MTAALIERLEKAEAGSGELGRDLLLHFGWHRFCYGHFYGPLYQWSAPDRAPCLISGDDDKLPNPTTSLDAALALAERVLPGCNYSIYRDVTVQPDGRCWAYVQHASTDAGCETSWASGPAATPALALCIAILKARTAAEPGSVGTQSEGRSEPKVVPSVPAGGVG